MTIEASLVTNEHRPHRTCLGCSGRDDQKILIRTTVTGGGELIIDPRGHGRGGYLHHTRECWELFLRRKNTHRAFRVNISKEAKQKFIQILNDGYRE